MNGIKIRVTVDGSKDCHDNGVLTFIVCTDKHYTAIDEEAYHDVQNAIAAICRSMRYKGWKAANVKLLSMEAER